MGTLKHSVWLLVVVVLVGVAALMTAAAASAAPPPAKAWTVMVYIDGDNNLEDYVVKDIETELSALGSNAGVNVVAIADRGPGYDTQPRRLADDQGLLLHAGHARRRGQRGGRLGRAQHG